jgi:hypothetical protein
MDPSTGVVTLEQYHDGDVLNRFEGPAEIVRDAETGSVVSQRYFIGGEEQPPPKQEFDFHQPR